MARKPRTTIDWAQWDDQLGKITDKELSEKIGSSLAAVSMRRKKIGVAASGERGAHPRIDWAEWDDVLGTVEDKILAKKVGCSLGSVVLRRKKLAIPAHNQRKSVDWKLWDEMIPSMADSELSKKIGCAPGSVRVRREKLGIARFDGDLRKKVDWDKWESRIGVVDDKDLALLVGCTVGAIVAHKKKRGIGILSEKEKVKRSGNNDGWSQWDHLLGRCPDDVLAELMGVTRSKVGVRRMRLVIANYPLDWPEGARPCLGGCGKALNQTNNDDPSCASEVCLAKLKEIS
ncbi:MAG: hypothetical protein ACJAR1_000748 [Rubritalea sp.]|jgi:hypothetical protein|tara:strand:+ start:5418 stop:6281 length:864 start_codon:yes stop_codon:yes gene_type:complete